MMQELRNSGVPQPGSWRDRHRHALAQRHAFGQLTPGARRRFLAWLAGDARLQASVHEWEAVLAQLSLHIPPLQPSPALWRRIERTLGPGPVQARSGSFGTSLLTALVRLLDASVLRLGGAALAGALACAFVLVEPDAPDPASDAATMPASYVGVLSTPADEAQLVVASLRYSRQVQLKLLRPLTPPAGHQAVLWGLASGVPPRAIARLPEGAAPRTTLDLDRPAEQAFSGFTRLAVSFEPAGSDLPSSPAGAFVLNGHCAKVW